MNKKLSPLIFTILISIISIFATGCATSTARNTSHLQDHPSFSRGTFKRIDRFARNNINPHGDINAAVLVVAKDHQVVYEQSFGRTELGRKVGMDSQFDVASLTKPMMTAAAIGMLQCRGELSLSDTIGPDSIGSLLLHETTLPENIAWTEFYNEPVTLQSVLIHSEDKRKSEIDYSNIGYALLALKAEEICGEYLEVFIGRELWLPLGMNQTSFSPSLLQVIRSAEDVDAGSSYDPLADFVLKTSHHAPGHSGLFSTAQDVTLFCQGILNTENDSVPNLECLSQFLFTTVSPASNRSFGFQKSKRNSWKHTGYTGCVMWLDPDSDTSMVLLTNATFTESDAFYNLQEELIRELDRGILRNKL